MSLLTNAHFLVALEKLCGKEEIKLIQVIIFISYTVDNVYQ